MIFVLRNSSEGIWNDLEQFGYLQMYEMKRV